MAEIRVAVAGALVAPLQCTTMLLFRATAESLWLALEAEAQGGRALEEVREHLARLRRLSAVLDQLGWTPPSERQALRLIGATDVLHDAAYGSLLDAGERLAAAAERSWHDGRGRSVVTAAAREVIALDLLLVEIERQRADVD